VWTGVADSSVSDRAALNDVLTASTTTAATLYDEVPAKELDYPTPASIDVQLETALSLLDPAIVSHYWLQILSGQDDVSVIIALGDTMGSSSAADDTATVWIAHPIDYVAGVPRALDPTLEQILTLRYLAQHQFVGATVTDLSVEDFGIQTFKMAVEYRYLHEDPNEL
jgi:hypothetical protein